MINLDCIPTGVVEDVFNWIESAGSNAVVEQAENMTPRQFFNAYCEWNGLIGWSGTLWDLVEDLKEAER